MAGEAGQRPEEVAWDRVGQFFGDMAAVTQRVWDRNLRLWNSVSKNVRTGEYSAGAMAGDAAKAAAVAFDNVDDIWTSLSRVPEREQVASALPTAFLCFGAYATPETVWIRVPPATDFKGLPKTATIVLTGPEQGLEALQECLSTTLERPKGYRLEVAAKQKVALHPGLYAGVVYLSGPPARPLANLRIVVEERAGERGRGGE